VCAKHYENPKMLSRVTAKNVGDVFLRHTVLPVSENGHPLYWNSTSGFNFELFIVVAMVVCIKFHLNRTTLGGVMTSYRFCMMEATVSKNLRPSLFLMTALVQECRYLFVHQISVRYLNPWLSYNHFRRGNRRSATFYLRFRF